MNIKRTIVGLLAVALTAFAATGAKADRFEDILKKGVVRIAVPLDVPPMGSQNAQREPEGFDVELAGMVAKALGAKLEMQQVTGANRIPFLLTDKVDIVISVMGLTPERAKQIMFTSPYADTNLAVFGPKSAKVTSAAEIGSLKVAAAKGTTQELALTAMNPKATIMRTEDDATAAAAYLSGQGRTVRHQQPAHSRHAEGQSDQGVRAEIHHPPQPRPYGRAHGRAQPGALARAASSSSTWQ